MAELDAADRDSGDVCVTGVGFYDDEDQAIPLAEVHPRFLSESVRQINQAVTASAP